MRQIQFIAVYLIMWAAHGQHGDAYHTPDQAKLDKERRAYTDAYLDALRYNRNAPSKSSASANDSADPAQELADLFAARAGKKTSAERARDEQAAQERARLAEQKQQQEYKERFERIDRMIDLLQRARSLRKPLLDVYLKAGFNALDAEAMALKEINSDYEKIHFKTVPGHYKALAPMQQLQEKLQTGDFEELAALLHEVQQYAGAPRTCLAAIDKLKVRFPGKEALLAALANPSYSNYFAEHSPYKSFYFGIVYGPIAKEFSTVDPMLYQWEVHFLRNPALAIAVGSPGTELEFAL